MDKKITAIALRSVETGDYDKRVTLLSADEGKVYAVMRGVRKPTAKLKFAAQPFSLCEYTINETHGKNVVTGASAIEDMYGLCIDPEKYSAAALTAEIVEKASDSLESSQLFILLLKTLKTLLLTETQSALIVIKFVQKLLSVSGFVKPVKQMERAEINTPSALLDAVAYKRLDELDEVSASPSIIKKSLKLICARYCSVYETTLTSLAVYEKMIV